MNIFIVHTDYPINDRRELFLLTRPFYTEKGWGVDFNYQGKNSTSIRRVSTIKEADMVFFPFSINYYVDNKLHHQLKNVNDSCIKEGKKAYAYIGDDFGTAFPEFSNIIYFRMGGFQSQLSQNNKGFPVGLSDHFQRLFKQETITPSPKCDLPVVGFCGHASFSTSKRLKEIAKCLIENGRRFLQKPFRKDWETLFASAYERTKLLKYFEKSALIKSNFIYRQYYRGGGQTDNQREQTTLEYYNNIANSDYIVCVRGAGNFSVRFYETLMMGKIPIFVNTDCLLPFDEQISWKQHVVWIEWKDRKKCAQIVSDFHQSISPDDFVQLQLNNRNLWKNTLSVWNMLTLLKSL